MAYSRTRGSRFCTALISTGTTPGVPGPKTSMAYTAETPSPNLWLF